VGRARARAAALRYKRRAQRERAAKRALNRLRTQVLRRKARVAERKSKSAAIKKMRVGSLTRLIRIERCVIRKVRKAARLPASVRKQLNGDKAKATKDYRRTARKAHKEYVADRKKMQKASVKGIRFA
jgi:hypothetical protein